MLHGLEQILEMLVGYAILAFEFMGVIILVLAGMKGFYNYAKHSPDTKRHLAQGLAMGLEFKIGGEVLRTVVVQDWTEIATLGGIILLRAALAFLIHWEMQAK